MNQILSVQAEAWLILSESQQVLACPSGSGRTYGPEMGITESFNDYNNQLYSVKILK